MKKLTFKHKLGYAMGDLGGCMTFAIVGSFLLPYYTEVVGISAAAVATLFLLARIWDAINDPMMGALLDKRYSKTKDSRGKFRPYLLTGAPLVALTAVLAFFVPGGLSQGGKLIWVYVTYIAYGMTYTFVNIPYGSLLSGMASTAEEKASLSSARGFGAMIGNVLPLVVFPIIIASSTENPQTGYFIGIIGAALVGMAFHLLAYKNTEERISHDTSSSNPVRLTDIIEVVKRNRAFLGISIAGSAAMLSQTLVMTLSVYYFRDNLNALSLMGLSMMVTLPLTLVVLASMPKIVKKIGMEKTAIYSTVLGMGISSILFLFPDNVWLFLAVRATGGTLISVVMFLQWGMIGDAIDYNHYILDKRTEGAIYGSFNFSRRLGQAIGSFFGALSIGLIGYAPSAAMQSATVLSGIRLMTLGAPIAGGLIVLIAIKYVWNIDNELRDKMIEKRNLVMSES